MVDQDVTGSANLLINASFGSDSGGFTYADDQFRGTHAPNYASGTRITTGGISGGTLKVTLGGVDSTLVKGMSGGWAKSFSLTAAARITVSFRYNVTQTPNYESDEVSQALVSIDGRLVGVSPNDWQAQIAGNGDGGSNVTTGIKTANADFGVLAAGTHKLVLGGFNNQKNNSNESTTILIDDVKVTSEQAGPIGPACDDFHCCPTGTTVVNLTDNADTKTITAAKQCVVAKKGADTISTSGSGDVVLGGDGDDRLTGVAGSQVRGGAGRDTINISGGAIALGNDGDDIISAGNGDNFVYPGAGVDTVALGTGNDTVVIYDLCEVARGEQIDGGTGTNTLITPVPLAQLQALGVVVANFQNIVVQSNSCLSDCGARPNCGGHGTCAEGASAGQVACQCDSGFIGPDCHPACPVGSLKTEPGKCGCNVADTDTDGDGTPDCLDPCSADASKVQPGICGCGVPDTDTDKDGVPDCADTCPADPNNTRIGSCGCVGLDTKAAGAVCTDSVCGKAGTCNGSGVCGNPDDCSPDPGKCVVRRYNGSTYWFCTGPVTRDQAQTKCQAVAGRILARIDTAEENQFVSNVITANAWLAANDLTTEGTWQWATGGGANTGDTFWSGNAGGTRVGNLFSRWGAGSPGGGATANCGLIQAGDATTRGFWKDGACSGTAGYVCEQVGTPLVPVPPKPIACDQFIPGNDCTPVMPPPSCIPDDQAFPQGAAQAQAEVAACLACGNDMACAAANCKGAAAPPPPGSVCEPFTAGSKRHCELTVADPNNLRPCKIDSQCNTASGEVCGLFFPPCSLCDTSNGTNCTNKCQPAQKVCGKFSPNCANESSPRPSCGQIDICPPPSETGLTTLDPTSDVTPEVFDPSKHFTPPAPPATTFPADPPCTTEPCSAGQNNAWCKFEVAQTLADQKVPESKQGSAGNGKKVQFIFDPDLNLDYHGSPLPFGESDFDFEASAGLKAGVKFNLPPPLNGEIDVIDAAGILSGTRCQATTANSRLLVLDSDFLPDALRFDTNKQPNPIVDKDACTKAIANFQEQVNRAKKAYKDAQEIIRQFKDIRSKGLVFGAAVCKELTDLAPADFKKGDCGVEKFEDTINHFVTYYNDKVEKLHQFQKELGDKVLNFNKNFQFGDEDSGQDEERRLFEANFFIGPVPATLQVNGMLNYGIGGGIDVMARPGAILNLSSDKEDIAFFKANATPFATAQVSLFVGAGFSFLGVTADAGVDGTLSLGHISAPLTAGAGVTIQAVDDDRPVPFDISSISSGLVKFPGLKSKKYEFAARYEYGAGIDINNVLGGSLSIKIEISFLFFSKTWRKTFLDYKGLSLPHIDLITGGGSTTAAGFRAWGVSQMPMPFMDIKHVNVGDLDPAPDGGTTMMASTSATPMEGTFVYDKVEKLFYNHLCTCAKTDEACDTTPDCCGNGTGSSVVCLNAPGGKKTCGACRLSGFCLDNSDCCTNSNVACDTVKHECVPVIK